jgi:glycosyltransferase involved in cell wall biosynthesis
MVKAMVLLIGNYPADQQQSMQRFTAMMLQGLIAAGIKAELVRPEAVLGNLRWAGHFITKWLAYIDKYVLFPFQLRRKLAAQPAILHICDHSNAVYVQRRRRVPVVVTCHDLLAVRGALGEQTDCPASIPGRFLQRWILNGLRKAAIVACVSRATAADAERLILRADSRTRISVVPMGLNYPYQKIPLEVARARLAKIHAINVDLPFVLHVGSNLRRKNRDGVLRIFARVKDSWDGQLVFAGDLLTPELMSLAKQLAIHERIAQIENPEGDLLESLYNCAVALLYPSRFEGFGWPIIEAHACGCPVICSTSGPLPEVAGEAGLFHPVDAEADFATDLLRLADPVERAQWSEKSLRNAERFSAKKMVAQYIEIYRSLGAKL